MPAPDVLGMLREAQTPFDEQRHNCGSAVLAAFAEFPAIWRVRRAWPLNARDILGAAEKAAAAAGCPPAGPEGSAWGVAELGAAHVLCARVAGRWMARAEPAGLAILPERYIVRAWSV